MNAGAIEIAIDGKSITLAFRPGNMIGSIGIHAGAIEIAIDGKSITLAFRPGNIGFTGMNAGAIELLLMKNQLPWPSAQGI